MTKVLFPDAPVTLAEALEAFLEAFAASVRAGARSDATLCMHREHSRWWCDHLNGSTPLAAIDERVIDLALHAERAGRRGRAISEGTVAKRLSTLRQTLALARRWRWIARMPDIPAVAPRYTPRVRHLRSPGELARLLRALPLEQAEWIAVAVFTGQHPSDVERMQAYIDADPFARPEGAADWLGHSSTQMLERVYAHALPPALGDVSAALDRFTRPSLRLLLDSLGVGTDAGKRRRRGRVDSTPPAQKTDLQAGALRTGRDGVVRRRRKGV